jgi:hypothetical protein
MTPCSPAEVYCRFGWNVKPTISRSKEITKKKANTKCSVITKRGGLISLWLYKEKKNKLRDRNKIYLHIPPLSSRHL